MTKWTKKELKALQVAVFGGAHSATGGRGDYASLERRDTLMENEDTARVCALTWLETIRDVHHEYSVRYAAFVIFLGTPQGQSVYPKSWEELKVRFTELVHEETKKSIWYENLRTKLWQAGKLPEL